MDVVFCIPTHPLRPLGVGWQYIRVTLSICPAGCVSNFVRKVSAEPLNRFFGEVLSWNGMWWKKNYLLSSWSESQRRPIIKVWLFLLYLLNCWSICNQIWIVSTAPWVRVSCEKKLDNCIQSRSQQRFNMLVNVCLDDTLWTAEHFVTKHGMLMQHHEPERYAEKN